MYTLYTRKYFKSLAFSKVHSITSILYHTYFILTLIALKIDLTLVSTIGIRFLWKPAHSIEILRNSTNVRR